jgi:hypothetical protein
MLSGQPAISSESCFGLVKESKGLAGSGGFLCGRTHVSQLQRSGGHSSAGS